MKMMIEINKKKNKNDDQDEDENDEEDEEVEDDKDEVDEDEEGDDEDENDDEEDDVVAAPTSYRGAKQPISAIEYQILLTENLSEDQLRLERERYF